MRTIAMINQKGGVGKTTTVANLAAALAARGVNTVAVDLDPQSHLTMHLGIESGRQPGLYEMFTEGIAVSAAAVCVQRHLWLVPAGIDLAGAEIELASVAGREQLLADRLRAEASLYDCALLDCPPALGLLTLNALCAADEVVIPLQPHFLALQGLGRLLDTVAVVRREMNPRLRVSGVIICMYESATRLAGEVMEDVEGFLKSSAASDPDSPWAQARVFETRIRRNIKLAEAPSFGQTIFQYGPHSHGANDYDALAEEFLQMQARAPIAQPPPAVPAAQTTASQPPPPTPQQSTEDGI